MTDLPIVIGTAGHVDHGKTTLIRTLTGVDTDRLAEEKRRGLTIDLGFAPFQLPSGRTASVVDVPGHEKFLKNMLAGVPGMDLALLVVAADDGVMPQTREHLEILSLLKVQKGLVVVTKTDLVDPELLELALDDIRGALAGTFLEGASMVPVSAPAGEGIPTLLDAIDRLAADTVVRRSDGPFRLPIDRVFVKQGFGTVITGTLYSGTLREGDAVEILPSGETSRVRGLQVHGGKRDQAVAGQRVAINLAGIERADLGRGDWVLPAGRYEVSEVLDVEIELLATAAPLEHRTRIRLHHGTAEILGRVHLLDREAIEPGGKALAQLLLEGPAVADHDDRFVLRLYAPARTIGGGTILQPKARKHKRMDPVALERLTHAREGHWAGVAEALLKEAGPRPVSRSVLAQALPFSEREGVLRALVESGVALEAEGGLMHAEAKQRLDRTLLDFVGTWHQSAPWRIGPSKDQIHAATQIPLALLSPALSALVAAGAIRATGRLYSLGDWKPKPVPALREARTRMLERLSENRFISETDLMEGLPDKAKDLLDDAVEEGLALRTGGIYADPAALETSKAKLIAHFSTEATITASQARELLETNRKAVIPLLEYLDSTGFTKRQGDVRIMIAPR